MRAPSVPAAPVINPFVIVVPCSAPNFLAPLIIGPAPALNPSLKGPLSVEASKAPLANPTAKATGETATTLAFAQNSFVLSTCYFLSHEILGNDTVGPAVLASQPVCGQRVCSFTSSPSACGWIIARRTIPQPRTVRHPRGPRTSHVQARVYPVTIMARAGTRCYGPAPTSDGGPRPSRAGGNGGVGPVALAANGDVGPVALAAMGALLPVARTPPGTLTRASSALPQRRRVCGCEDVEVCGPVPGGSASCGGRQHAMDDRTGEAVGRGSQ